MVIVKQVPTKEVTATGDDITVPKVIDEGKPVEDYSTKKIIFRTYQVLWYVLGIVEILLLFRFLLRMFEANPSSPFVAFVYAISIPILLPFWGIFGNTQALGSVIEWSTIFAMFVYFVVVVLVVKFFRLVKPVTPKEVETTVD
jgi:hypothetical protein